MATENSGKEILLNIESRETRAAYLHHGRLVELIIERRATRQVTGNIYRGKVKNILHNIQSAFIDIGESENGFIHIEEILENRKRLEQQFEMDFEGEGSSGSDGGPSIEEVLQPDQPVLVQVVKEPIGSKGYRLTSRLSLSGRYLVLLPNTPHFGVSRRIEDPAERERLKRLMRTLGLEEGMGLICRTASAHTSREQLLEELEELVDDWEEVRKRFEKATRPCLLYEESDLVKRLVLQAVDKRYQRILIDEYEVYQRCKALYHPYEQEHPLRIELYRDKVPMFERFNVEREIDRALKRKVWLKNGGYLFFDQTEAMRTIDVNSGRGSGGGQDGASVEESLVQINLDAAEEIAHQLRIRNIGGLIICDFIDMRSRKNRKRVLERLRDAMKEDDAKCTILGMSEFGLVEMTRQRQRPSLAQMLLMDCPYCEGRGAITSFDSTLIALERSLKRAIKCEGQYGLRVLLHPELHHHFEREDQEELTAVMEELHGQIDFEIDENLHLNDYRIFSSITGEELAV